MNYNFANTNVVLVALILFVISYSFIVACKPSFLYRKDNTLRSFGVGYKNKTIFPLWLFSLILAVLCYLVVLYYLEFQRNI